MSRTRFPVTSAIRVLRAAKAEFEPHLYPYVARGGTRASSTALGVTQHQVIKTLIMQTDTRAGLVVLMHGDRQVSTRQLARILGCKQVGPCDPAVAQRLSGYQVGGTSPFGLRTALPIYAEQSIAALNTLYINGGKRGFLVSMSSATLIDITRATLIEVGTSKLS